MAEERVDDRVYEIWDEDGDRWMALAVTRGTWDTDEEVESALSVLAELEEAGLVRRRIDG